NAASAIFMLAPWMPSIGSWQRSIPSNVTSELRWCRCRETRVTKNVERPRNAFCSFCRKSHSEVGPLVEGPDNAYVCGACVDLFQDMIDRENCQRSFGNDPLAYLRLKGDRIARIVDDIKLATDAQLSPFSKSA